MKNDFILLFLRLVGTVMVTWVEPWRQRLVQNENKFCQEQRCILRKSISVLEKKKLRLTKAIQRQAVERVLIYDSLIIPRCRHEESYDAYVKEASLRNAPNQNGSNRTKFLNFASREHKSEIELRPSDRQIFSRFYSKVDENFWRSPIGDELRSWYTDPPSRTRSAPSTLGSTMTEFESDRNVRPATGYLSMPSERRELKTSIPKVPFLAPVFAPNSDSIPAGFLLLGRKNLLN